MKTTIQTQYGPYTMPVELPDQDVFKLRYAALIRHEGFKELCNRPGVLVPIDDKIRTCVSSGAPYDAEIYSAWSNIDSWLETTGKDDPLMLCFLLYGNIHKNTYQQSWTWFKNSFHIISATRRLFPYGFSKPYSNACELTPGMIAPEGLITFTLDPAIQRDEAIEMFKKFLTRSRARIKSIGKNKSPKQDPLYGYFFTTEKRYDPDTIERYFDIYDLKNSQDVKHPKAWQKKATSKFKDVYPSKPESRRRTMLRDMDNAGRIIQWSVFGKFPCTKKI